MLSVVQIIDNLRIVALIILSFHVYVLFTVNQIWFVPHSEYLKNLMARKEKGVLASHQIVSRL